MPYQIACHNIKQMTIDYHYSWIWLETTGFKKNHKETGLILKVEKQTDDCFEPRKPKYFEKLLLFGKTIQQVSKNAEGNWTMIYNHHPGGKE